MYSRNVKQRTGSENVNSEILAYREIQLLSNFYNSMHRHILIPVYNLIPIVCFCCPIFILVKGFNKLTLTAGTIFSNALILGTVIMLFCLHYPVKVICSSRECLGVWRKAMITHSIKQHICRENNVMFSVRLMEKYYRSLRPVRVYLFQNGHFDRSTPFNLFHFSVRVAIKMIIILME